MLKKFNTDEKRVDAQRRQYQASAAKQRQESDQRVKQLVQDIKWNQKVGTKEPTIMMAKPKKRPTNREVPRQSEETQASVDVPLSELMLCCYYKM